MKGLTWQERSKPLQPLGVLIGPDQRASAIKHLLKMDDQRLRRLRGGYCDSMLVILGEERDLPWIPSGIYLGKEPHAAHVFTPVMLSPNVPVDLLDRAICDKLGEGQFAIHPWMQEIYDLSRVLALSRGSLEELS